MADPDRTRTFNLSNFNMAIDALQRASRLASVYDMSEQPEQVELRKALNAELALAGRLMTMVEYKPARTK